MPLKYQLIEHVSLTNVNNDIVLFDMHAGQYYGLNHVGAQFLNLTQNNIGFDEAIIQIAQSFAIDYNQVKDDINDRVNHLIEKTIRNR